MQKITHLVIVNNVCLYSEDSLRKAYKAGASLIKNSYTSHISTNKTPPPSYENVSKYVKDKGYWSGRFDIGYVTFQKVVVL